MISPVEHYHQPIFQDNGPMPPTLDGPRVPVIPSIDEHIKVSGIPSVRCKACLKKDVENWVIPGLPCSNCQTVAPSSM